MYMTCIISIDSKMKMLHLTYSLACSFPPLIFLCFSWSVCYMGICILYNIYIALYVRFHKNNIQRAKNSVEKLY